MLDRWRTIVNGHSAKSTITRRGAQQWADVAEEGGLDAHVERTQLAPCCGTHACPGGSSCPDYDGSDKG